MKKISIYLITVITSLSAVTFAAQPDLDALFSLSVNPSALEVEQGSSTVIDVTLTVAPEHFVYQERTSVSVETPEETGIPGVEVGSTFAPEPELKKDPFDGEMKPIYKGTVNFRVPLSVSGNAESGTREIPVVVRYQGCSQSMCYFPQTKNIPVTLTIIEGDGAPNAAPMQDRLTISGETAQTGSDLENWLSKGYLFTYILVFFFGVLTSLTPCVYPLIPITVTIFGARDSENKMQAFSLALTYVLGIAFMYSTLGFAAARTGAVFGQIMSNPWVIGGIAVFFASMGASMLGAFEFQLPSSWQSRLGQVGGKGYISAYLMGLVAGIVAAPCTGPVLAGILAYVAKEGNPVFGVSLLFVYSLGLGLLFLVIGTFSGFLSKLPKSGGWMEGVKSVFGIILFACALYFLKDVFKVLRVPLSSSLMTYAFAFVLLVTGIALGAVHLSFHTPDRFPKIKKSVGVVFCIIALYVGFGSLTVVEAGNVEWFKTLDEGFAAAREKGKPVMIDFYADWCVVCKEIDAKTYADKRVGEALKRFVNIKIDLTAKNEENTRISEMYAIVGLPLIVFLDSKQDRLPQKRIDGFIDSQEFLRHIEDIR